MYLTCGILMEVDRKQLKDCLDVVQLIYNVNERLENKAKTSFKNSEAACFRHTTKTRIVNHA